MRKLSLKVEPKLLTMNKVAATKALSSKSLSVVSSIYEADGINRRQYATLTINGQVVRPQPDAASNIALVSQKNVAKLG